MPGDDVVDMVPVLDGFMAAVGAVGVIFVMVFALVPVRALVRVPLADRDRLGHESSLSPITRPASVPPEPSTVRDEAARAGSPRSHRAGRRPLRRFDPRDHGA